MMIRRLVLGITNTYLIKGSDGCILIDAGVEGKEKDFLRKLKRIGVNPSEIRLIILTHTHFDHVGSLAAIKRACVCPVLVHEDEAQVVESGRVTIPPGTGPLGVTMSALGKVCRPFFRYKPVQCEINVGWEDVDLSPYGIRGRIITTPGHTKGSLSVVLENGDAFVGDLAMNLWGNEQLYPIFAELPRQVYSSWQRVLDSGALRIHVAHGPSFSRKQMEDWMVSHKASISSSSPL